MVKKNTAINMIELLNRDPFVWILAHGIAQKRCTAPNEEIADVVMLELKSKMQRSVGKVVGNVRGHPRFET